MRKKKVNKFSLIDSKIERSYARAHCSRPPFDMFVKLPKNEEWRALVDRFRQIYDFRNLIIRLEIGE